MFTNIKIDWSSFILRVRWLLLVVRVSGLYGVVTERRREEGQDAVARRILT